MGGGWTTSRELEGTLADRAVAWPVAPAGAPASAWIVNEHRQKAISAAAALPPRLTVIAPRSHSAAVVQTVSPAGGVAMAPLTTVGHVPH